MRTSVAVILFAALGWGAYSAVACDGCGKPTCCAHCGRQACCEKVCQVVCEVKKETKTCWTVEYREFCTLLPGCHGKCDCCPPPPRCGRDKCVGTLVKHEYQVDVPVYKCVVIYLCPECADSQPAGAPAAPAARAPSASAPMPPMPPAPPAASRGPR